MRRGHKASELTITSIIQANAALPELTEEGYTATFDLITATGPVAAPVNLALQRFTLTLDEQYNLTTAEKDFFKKSYGVELSDGSPLWQMADLNDFMQRTGLHAEQVERLLCQRAYAVRLSPNCPSKNLQHAGVTISGVTGKVLRFPHASHYGACYVNGTGTGSDLFDSQIPPTCESIIRDQFDNSIGLEQVEMGDTKYWRLTKTSLDRFDRLQRMVRLQRWTGIPFAKLDTLIICAIRAEGEANLGMELNQNTLRALGVYRHLNRRHGIDAQEFAALMHDLTPYASGKDEVPLFDQVFNRVQLFDTPLILDQTPIDLAATDAATQKTLLQLCAGLGLQPTEESLLLIARQTETHLETLKRDLPTVSSIYRQARIAQLFGLSVAELLTLAVLLGGLGYKSLLASGQLNPPTQPEIPDIPATPETPEIPGTPEIPHVVDLLDVLMQLDWAVCWLKDSQQTVTLLQQRLGPNIPLKATADIEGAPSTATYEYPPLSDELLARLSKLHDDTDRSVVTEKQLAALGLPTADLSNKPIFWFKILADLIDDNGLLLGLDEALTRVDVAPVRIREKVKNLLEPMNLPLAVKDECEEKLVGLLLVAHDTQAQVFEGLFQETAKLSPELTAAVIHWTGSTFYSLLLDALDKEDNSALIDQFQRVSQHAEIVISLRLSNSALRLFLINPQWLGVGQYPESYGEPSFADLYLFERFSHWLHAQSQPEDTLLSYFSLANPIPSKLKNKALRKKANETANSALAFLLEWPEEEIAVLTDTLPDKRARSMAQVDWIRRCQATSRASGLSAKALLQATELNDQSTWEVWKAVGDAVMASHCGADSLPVNGYDSLYQLVEATGWEAGEANRGPGFSPFNDPAPRANYRQTYHYDAGGNLLELIHEGPQSHGHRLVAEAHSNRCLPVLDSVEPGDEDFRNSFDANGNLLQLQPGQALSWDLRNQLREVRPVARDAGPDDVERYVYGADGMRVRKVSLTQTNARTLLAEVRYLPNLELRTHSGTGEVLQVISVQAGRSTIRVLHWEQAPSRATVSDQYRYSLNDHLGSCSLELDSAGEVISQEGYHPFGTTAWFADRGEVEASYKTVRYSGKEQDATGLYYYGFRYYVPWLQRWANPDPAGYADGINLYQMVGNNPVNFIDQRGLAASQWFMYADGGERELNDLEVQHAFSDRSPKIILSGDGHSIPPLQFASDIPDAMRAYKEATLGIYVEGVDSEVQKNIRKFVPGFFDPQRVGVIGWEPEHLVRDILALFELVASHEDSAKITSVDLQEKADRLGASIVSNLFSKSEKTALKVSALVAKFTSEAGFEKDTIRNLSRVLTGEWRDEYINPYLAEKIASIASQQPGQTLLVSVGDAHLDSGNNPVQVLLNLERKGSAFPHKILFNRSKTPRVNQPRRSN
ncbi:hypothetical protein PS914_00496 [Pseudomonas fluorescens]|nr:RHS repeat-associated core domain-containing protein [Pseudomonas fluorescens]VVP67200.1 hypothetical protein PS914_00496 [Pseudomonas fluorescens]